MSRLFEALSNSADGAFVIDEDLRIVYCNKAAEVLLGFEKEDVIGQFCYRLLRGSGDGKQLVCNARCQVAKMALDSKPVPNCDLHIATNYGVKRWMNISVFTYRLGDSSGKKVVVHLFHDLNHNKVNEMLLTDVVRMLNGTKNNPPKNGNGIEHPQEALTHREGEILTLLASGGSTSEIGESLSISKNTVRNHVQHILQKLHVHTRLEAVTYAMKNDLISY